MNTSACSVRRDFAALVGLSFLLLFCGIYATRAYVMDDALITLRYSFNLARHGHAIWNQADAAHPSLGYTTVLWMLINAAPAFFTDNKDCLVLFCKLLGLIPLAAIAVLLVDPISRMPVSLPYRIAVVLAIFSQGLYGFHLNSGMETLLFSCLILLTVRSYARDDPSGRAYAFGTLAFLTRPEGAIVVALMLIWDLRRRRIRQAAVGGICFSIAALLLGLVLHATYGTVLPNAFFVKQKAISLGSLKFTLTFLASIALPYLPLAGYSVNRLKNTASRYCLEAAIVYTVYYVTVTPLMNVFSRYQWPVLVLLTYASLPALQKLGERKARRSPLALGLLALFALVNLRSGMAASYLATQAGTEEKNLITLGKAMAKHRDANKWLAYHDAGAICYYSDWNSYDTVGLNTRQIAMGSIKPMQVYRYRHTDLVIANRNETDVKSWRDCAELGARLGRLGYRYAGTVPLLTEGAQRPFVVLLYARSRAGATSWLQGVQVASEMPVNPLYRACALGERIFGSHRTFAGP